MTLIEMNLSEKEGCLMPDCDDPFIKSFNPGYIYGNKVHHPGDPSSRMHRIQDDSGVFRGKCIITGASS